MKFLNPIQDAAKLVQDALHRLVTDDQITSWNNKSDTDTVTTINGKTGAIAKSDIVALGIPGESSAAPTYMDVNNVESKASGRLQYFQKSGDAVIMPDGGWWHLIRMQHAGYAAGYWNEIAFPFSGHTIMHRYNNNGTMSAWEPINGGTPKGVITMWSGLISAIPAGWALCNGSNGTPNLLDKFIMGATTDVGMNLTGGASTVALSTANLASHGHAAGTIAAATGGAHGHTGSAASAGAHTHTLSGSGSEGGSVANFRGWPQGTMFGIATSSAGTHGHTVSIVAAAGHGHTMSGSTANAGSGTAHENKPPYYTLAYIMKL